MRHDSTVGMIIFNSHIACIWVIINQDNPMGFFCIFFYSEYYGVQLDNAGRVNHIYVFMLRLMWTFAIIKYVSI